MVKYEIKIHAISDNNPTGFVNEKEFIFYGSYLNQLLRKFELLKNDFSSRWILSASIHKVENIRTMTISDVTLHINNDKEYIYICSFQSYGNCSEG